jgi:aminoglycoside phosphotransferase (APT) family kinase protein
VGRLQRAAPGSRWTAGYAISNKRSKQVVPAVFIGVSIEIEKLEQVIQIIAPDSTLLRAWTLQGGISAEMTAFEIQHREGQTHKMILRQPSLQVFERNPHAAEDEFKVLQLTESLGLATPTPYYLDQSGTIFSTPYLVMEFIDGNPEFPAAPKEHFTFQLARHLAMIHRADYSNQDISFLPKAANKCVEVSRAAVPNVHLSLDVEHIRNALEEISSLPQRNKSVLLHGDYWPGNLLWRDDMIVAMIDWEDAQIGDPLIDFAISRLDILWIFGADAWQSFTDHYQSLMDIDYRNLPYWDLCAALRLARMIGDDLAEWTAFFLPFGRRDITEHTFVGNFRYFITQALEKLAIQ